jgi:hypothetical protein
MIFNAAALVPHPAAASRGLVGDLPGPHGHTATACAAFGREEGLAGDDRLVA